MPVLCERHPRGGVALRVLHQRGDGGLSNRDAVFTTERLIVRPWGPDDLDAAFRMYSDAEVTYFLGEPDADVETTATRVRSAEQRSARGLGLGFWAIEERDDGRVAGAVILKPLGDTEEIEVGYHLARDSWGRGIATEAAAGALRHGFTTVGLDRIVAVVNPDNSRSLRVITKLGMRHEGRRHHYGFELEYFALGRDEWQARQHPPPGAGPAG